MLKRYTHLNARKLVQKLEGKKNKGVANVLGGIVPYPASIAKEDGIYTVKLLDFTDLSSKSNERESAVFMAQYALLSQLISKMRDGNPIPLPDSYLDAVDESCLIMIDPLKASVALS
jgi:predicted RNase H-like HicB family nuclease